MTKTYWIEFTGWNCHISLLSDDVSNMPSPRSLSRNFENETAFSNIKIDAEDETMLDSELNRLLPPPR